MKWIVKTSLFCQREKSISKKRKRKMLHSFFFIYSINYSHSSEFVSPFYFFSASGELSVTRRAVLAPLESILFFSLSLYSVLPLFTSKIDSVLSIQSFLSTIDKENSSNRLFPSIVKSQRIRSICDFLSFLRFFFCSLIVQWQITIKKRTGAQKRQWQNYENCDEISGRVERKKRRNVTKTRRMNNGWWRSSKTDLSSTREAQNTKRNRK